MVFIFEDKGTTAVTRMRKRPLQTAGRRARLRAASPVEPAVAGVRHRTRVTQGPGSGAAGLAMAFKGIQAARDHWRIGQHGAPRRARQGRGTLRTRCPDRAPRGGSGTTRHPHPAEEPTGEGKYAQVERERRFLLTGPPPPPAVTASRRITDRYLPGTRLRLRRIDYLRQRRPRVQAHPEGARWPGPATSRD